MYILSVCKNCAPVAPSTVLWSQAKDNFIVLPTTICPSFTTGFWIIAPTDKIAEFGYEKITVLVIKEQLKTLSKENMIQKVSKYPISKGMKLKIIDYIEHANVTGE